MPKRNRTKEKGTPFPRPAGILPSGFVAGGWAFRQHILVLAKRQRLPVVAPAGLFIHHPPLHRGPGGASALPARQKHVREAQKGRRPLCFPGPSVVVVDRRARPRRSNPFPRAFMVRFLCYGQRNELAAEGRGKPWFSCQKRNQCPKRASFSGNMRRSTRFAQARAR